MIVRLLVALLVMVGPLPCHICTCPAHAHEKHTDSEKHSHHHDGGHCCCHVPAPPDTLPTPALDMPSDADLPSLAWAVASENDECPVGYKFVPFRFARSVPLYITFQTLLN